MIYLYNLAVNTQDDNFHKYNWIQDKIAIVKHALNEIKQVLDSTYKSTENQAIRAILVAPEYFFARSYPEHHLDYRRPPSEWLNQINRDAPNRKGRHYDYNDYITIRKELAKLSKNFPSILIIPGTVAWKEPVTRSAPSDASAIDERGEGPSAFDPLMVAHASATSDEPCNTLIQASPTVSWENGVRLETYEDYYDHMKSIGEAPDQTSWESYRHEQADEKIKKISECLNSSFAGLFEKCRRVTRDFMDEDRKKQLPKWVLELGSFLNSLSEPDKYINALWDTKWGLAWNTAFFYLNGKKVAEYSKQSDFQEVLFFAAENHISLPVESPSVFNIAGLEIGIEICFDHACDVLENYLKASTSEKPDIHLILSAWVKPKASLAKTSEGFIHSSSNLKVNIPSSTEHLEVNLENGKVFRCQVAKKELFGHRPSFSASSTMYAPKFRSGKKDDKSLARTGKCLLF